MSHRATFFEVRGSMINHRFCFTFTLSATSAAALKVGASASDNAANEVPVLRMACWAAPFVPAAYLLARDAAAAFPPPRAPPPLPGGASLVGNSECNSLTGDGG
eukprot:6172243-Pleurochrysis_carterae.AAC.3